MLHQGVCCVLIPAVLSDHLEAGHPGLTLDQLDKMLQTTLWQDYRTWCRGNSRQSCGHRFSLIRFGREKWNRAPELGSIYKAAVVKDLLLWCSDYMWGHQDGSSDSLRRASCVYALAAFQRLVDASSDFFKLRRQRWLSVIWSVSYSCTKSVRFSTEERGTKG